MEKSAHDDCARNAEYWLSTPMNGSRALPGITRGREVRGGIASAPSPILPSEIRSPQR